MKIIIVIILGIFFYPPLTTQDDVATKNQVLCYIAGAMWTSSYVFDISQVPERCDIIAVGKFSFDIDDGVNTHVMELDKGIIRSLVKAKKTVYLYVGFMYKDDWGQIFNPSNADIYQKQYFEPLINLLNEFEINGLILSPDSLYEIGVHNPAQSISAFVSAIKEKIHTLVVGLKISGPDYKFFSNNLLFDFTITNKVLDLYAISWSILNSCEGNIAGTSANPITSDNSNVTTIEQVICGVTNSSIDKTKLYAMMQMTPMIPINLLPKTALWSITTYSIYCSSTDKANSSQWCTETSKSAYDKGAYAKQNSYVGIFLEQLDTEDYECKCECGQFPVTNLIIDGWTGSPFKACPKLDQN